MKTQSPDFNPKTQSKKPVSAMHKLSGEEIMDQFVAYVDEDVVFIRELNPGDVSIPKQHPYTIIAFCHKGYMRIKVGENEHELYGGDVYICPSGAHIHALSIDSNTSVSALCMTDRIIQALLNTNASIWNRAIYVRNERLIHQRGVVEMDDHRAHLGMMFAQIMHVLISNTDNPFRKEMMYLMLQMMLLGYCAHVKEQDQPPVQHTMQGERLFNNFLEMLNNETIKHQTVEYYAQRLNVTPKYLSYVCKRVSGKLASEFIKNAVTGEIIHYLDNTSLSTKEIAMRMGFSNISFFGKFVKQRLGMSPNNYRAARRKQ